ncbi:MAG TPA: sulfatase/phosphatase domain-containing protein, partial [Actinomycetota bacterium]|nr:sulfatase/phosphatase domain-containing protein [Actinomycetota bacterium]
VAALRDGRRLSDTILLFASDNGYIWGEHGMDGKGVPYEESIRVPLVMRYDDLGARTAAVEEMALNVDLAPTIAALTRIDAPTMEGMSLVPLLTGEGRWARRDFLIEHLGAEHVPSFCAVRTTRSKYAASADGSEELYDLRRDPFELENLIGVAPPRRVAALRARLTELCDPLPPGYPGVPGPAGR